MKLTNIKQKIFNSKFIKVLIILVILINYPWFYFGGPIEGKVTDVNGNPIANVVLVMQFAVTGSKNLHGFETTTIMGLEVLTNDKGIYKFPWWITSKRPIYAWDSAFYPTIKAYKNGYKAHTSLYNKYRDESKWLSMYVKFSPSEDIIKLEKYVTIEKQKEDWLLHTGRGTMVWGGVHWADFECGWEVFPLYFLENEKVTIRLKRISKTSEYSRIFSPVFESETSSEGCIPAKQFFNQYKDKLKKQG